ncbi:MAG: gliding motility protein GldM [Bacteroidota bacterium]
MSIPKSPRQLMINLMYLVLLALLAINVSAEIINAFFQIDKGIAKSNAIIDDTNDYVTEVMQKNAEQDPEKYQALVDAAQAIRTISRDFNAYFDERREELVAATQKGYYPADDPKHPNQPKAYKDKDVTTRVLVNGYEKDGQQIAARGPEMEAKIEATRSKILEIIRALKGSEGTNITEETIADLEKTITLEVSDDWKKSEKKSWAEFTFKKMPLASVFPILRKFQNDMKSTEAAVINFLSGQIGAKAIKVDNFVPIASPEKSYIIAGEPYKAQITIGASSKSVYDNMTIAVKGQNLNTQNGIATYVANTSTPGIHQYDVDIAITNPTTGERETYKKTFEYEVGRRSVTVAADQMNVFYIGVDNPISISATGVSSNALRITGSGAGIRLSGNGSKRVVRVSRPEKAKITVSGGGLSPTNFEFRVKRIPDPIPQLGNRRGGSIPSGEFRAQEGLLAVLKAFDFNARCKIQSFELVRAPKMQDAISSDNTGGRYNARSQRLVASARPGDTYYFDKIKARCPGDDAGRPLGQMIFNIR